MIALLVIFLILVAGSFLLWKSVPILSQPYRVKMITEQVKDYSYERKAPGAWARIVLIPRFKTTASFNERDFIVIGEVKVDDDEFDAKMAALNETAKTTAKSLRKAGGTSMRKYL